MSQAIDYYLTALSYVVENFRTQNGTRRYPARSCRELHLDFPEYLSGMLKIDLISYLVFSHTSPTLSSTKLPQWKHFERAWDLTNVSILGRYWIDPNEGCIDDAVQVYCDFEEQVNCIEPKNHKVGTLPIL